MHKRKQYILIAIVSVVIVTAAVALFLIFRTQGNSDTATRTIDNQKLAAVEGIRQSSQKDFVEKYSTDASAAYVEAYNSIQSTPPEQWDANHVVDAYFVIEYAKKNGPSNVIVSVLDMIKSAQTAGLDVDIEESGYDQKYRDSLYSQYIADVERMKAYSGSTSSEVKDGK